MKKIILFLSLFILIDCYLIKGGIPLRDEVYDYRFKRLDGGYSTLNEFSDDTILIYFFSSYCLPCIKDIEYFKSEMEYFHKNRVSIIGVGMDYNREITLAPFVDYYKLAFPVMIADNSIIEGRWIFGKISEIPSTIIINKREKRYRIISGNINKETIFESR